MTNEDREVRDGMDPQDDEALWALLGRQESPARVSPYFSRRVLREAALAEETPAVGWRRWLPSGMFCRRTALWSGVWSGAGAMALFCLMHTGGNSSRLNPSAKEDRSGLASAEVRPDPALEAGTNVTADEDSVPVQEVEVIADLDNILQREESRLWTDENFTARF